MIKQIIKSMVHNRTLTLLQCFLPFICIGYVHIFSLIFNNMSINSTGILNYITFIFFYIPILLIGIYPFISFFWCIFHFEYCLKIKKNRVFGTTVFVLSSIILFIDVFTIFPFYIMFFVSLI